MAEEMIKLPLELKTQIRDAFEPLHPEKVILLGSQTDASEIRRDEQQFRPRDYERGGSIIIKRASEQWMESAEMDIGSIGAFFHFSENRVRPIPLFILL